jgi:tetratricopeptide (TPR) repeat protein
MPFFINIIYWYKKYENMRNLKYIFLLLTTILTSCGSVQSNPEEKLALAEQGYADFQQALTFEKEGKFMESIMAYEKAIAIYQDLDSAVVEPMLYYSFRFKAKMLSNLTLYDLATASIQTSLDHLAKVDELPKQKSIEAEKISSQSYKADYMRNNGDYLGSNDLLIELLKKKEVTANSHIQFKNLIALNYLDLGDVNTAYGYFADILKVDGIDPVIRSYYLNNKSDAAFKLDMKQEAYQDLSEAIGIASALKNAEAEMRFRKNLGEYHYLEGDFRKAVDAFDKALLLFPTVDQNPELFEIYNLKHAAALVLGDSEAFAYKEKYNELQAKHMKIMEQLKAANNLSILNSKMEKAQIEEERNTWAALLQATNVTLTAGAVVLIMIFGALMLVLAAWRSRRSKFA